MKKIITTLFFIATTFYNLYSQDFEPLVENINSSFRGISVSKNKHIWVSGSNGTVGLSENLGKTWKWVNPKGYEAYDFRDIISFSNKEAIIMSSGNPSVLLKTMDGGSTWQEVYKDQRKEIFFDDMVFQGKVGFVLGDPIDASFQLLKSIDKGNTWKDVSNDFILFADEGEAAFAASGSNMKMFKHKLYIATGGLSTSFFNYNPKDLRIDKYEVPIWNGKTSTGIFSIDFWDQNTGIAVGGNYLADNENANNILLTNDAGVTWTKPKYPVFGYRSAVKYITNHLLLATGTSGTDISSDGGKTWRNISILSFNSIGLSENKKHIFLTGSKGNVYKLKI